MYSRLHFANYSLLRIRDLSGPYRHRCTPQKKSCWHKEGENTCLSQTELSTSQVFSVYIFQFAKLIPFLLLPAEFTILWSVLCEVRTEREIDGELSVIYGISLWFVPYSISVPDNVFWRESVLSVFCSYRVSKWLSSSCHLLFNMLITTCG